MDTTKEEEKADDEQQQQQQQQQKQQKIDLVEKLVKGKSCKGYLFYSSSLKSHHRNPRCIGIPRALPQVPNYVIRHSELEASEDGRVLIDFYYACVGYSVYKNVNAVSTDMLPNVNDVSTDKGVTRRQLPVCFGLELLVDRKAPAPSPTPARAHDREDMHERPQSRVHNKPAHQSGENFLNRFTRNANLVASGVAKNMRRVGNYVKEGVEDIMYPYRKRPK
ncbi:uncharacterized protein LOC123199711 [Mangifera indica]|uniref:uncharacterized protein LOC123199711 n=1 Tax=Mangifera indica TaxID=29780 RepID=UPI001CFAB423|nr:uncharacterized protein LOC123199711 [Mangifera indica]